MMKEKEKFGCPFCGETERLGTNEIVPAVALGKFDEQGEFEYSGETELIYDGQMDDPTLPRYQCNNCGLSFDKPSIWNETTRQKLVAVIKEIQRRASSGLCGHKASEHTIRHPIEAVGRGAGQGHSAASPRDKRGHRRKDAGSSPNRKGEGRGRIGQYRTHAMNPPLFSQVVVFVADFIGFTTSNDAKIIRKKELEKLIKKYSFGEVTVKIENDRLAIYGYDFFNVWGKDYEEELTEEFLEELRGFIAPGEALVIQSIGYEKLRYPFGASEIIVTNDTVLYNGFLEPDGPSFRLRTLHRIAELIRCLRGQLGPEEDKILELKKIIDDEIEAIEATMELSQTD